MHTFCVIMVASSGSVDFDLPKRFGAFWGQALKFRSVRVLKKHRFSKIQNKIQERILGVYFNQKTQDFVLYDLKTNWKFKQLKVKKQVKAVVLILKANKFDNIV